MKSLQKRHYSSSVVKTFSGKPNQSRQHTRNADIKQEEIKEHLLFTLNTLVKSPPFCCWHRQKKYRDPL
jgi:hypothetical protein